MCSGWATNPKPGRRSRTSTPLTWWIGRSARRRRLRQTSERVGGVNLYQSIAVPKDLKANRGLTVYGLLLHVFMVFMMVLSLVIAVVALVVKIRAMIRRTDPALGVLAWFRQPAAHSDGHYRGHAGSVRRRSRTGHHGCGEDCLGRCPAREARTHVLELAGHPGGVHSGGVGVVRVLARLIEVASLRGVIRFPPRKGAIGDVMTGRDPVLASTRLGRVLFWVTAVTMLSVLLMFAFWGLFVY